MMTQEECCNALTKLQDVVTEHLSSDASKYHEEHEEGTEMNESLAMMIGQNSMRNGYGYGDGTWNNPFMYLIFLALFGRNGFGYGGDCGNLGVNEAMRTLGEIKTGVAAGGLERTRIADQIANIGTQMGFSKDFLYSAIVNNGDKLCCAVNAIQGQLANGNKDILQQLCCLGSNLQQGLAGLALSNERQTNALQQNMAALGFAAEKNASDLKFQIAREGCETRQASHADRDAILQYLTQDKINSLQEKLAAASMEISQRNQTDTILNALRTGSGTGYGQYPPYVNALFPNGSQAYPLWVNNTPQTA